jgi:hypothetical protein
MRFIKILIVATITLLSHTVSASLLVTGNGFIDNTHNLEWLAPSKIQSVTDYNTYVNAGWKVATTNDLETILATPLFTKTYSAFDQSVFNGFKAISNTSGSICGQAFFCSVGWYLNQSTDGQQSFGYELGWIGLFSNPAQTNSNIVEQQKLNIGAAFITSTLGSYPLYGFGNSFDTFMVRAVPLPSAAWLFGSAIFMVGGRKYKKRSKSASATV